MARPEDLTRGTQVVATFVVAIVLVNGDEVGAPRYLRWPFHRAPYFGVTSVNHDLGERLAGAGEPS